MTNSYPVQEARDHFAHCVQVFGGIPATARRLDIDERAIRRFINGERPNPRLSSSSGITDSTMTTCIPQNVAPDM